MLKVRHFDDEPLTMTVNSPHPPSRAAERAPTPTQVTSRWRRGTLSFGPAGRVAWTVGVSSPGLWLTHHIWHHGLLPRYDQEALMVQLFGGVFAITWMGWIWPRAMRDIWARQVVDQPGASRPASLSVEAPPESALARFVALQPATPTASDAGSADVPTPPPPPAAIGDDHS
jgi:hypothetical protein